jgi:hypothetical protein
MRGDPSFSVVPPKILSALNGPAMRRTPPPVSIPLVNTLPGKFLACFGPERRLTKRSQVAFPASIEESSANEL